MVFHDCDFTQNSFYAQYLLYTLAYVFTPGKGCFCKCIYALAFFTTFWHPNLFYMQQVPLHAGAFVYKHILAHRKLSTCFYCTHTSVFCKQKKHTQTFLHFVRAGIYSHRSLYIRKCLHTGVTTPNDDVFAGLKLFYTWQASASVKKNLATCQKNAVFLCHLHSISLGVCGSPFPSTKGQNVFGPHTTKKTLTNLQGKYEAKFASLVCSWRPVSTMVWSSWHVLPMEAHMIEIEGWIFTKLTKLGA